MVNIDIEKQKKIIENITGTKWDNMDKTDTHNVGLDSMKKTLCNLRYGNFLDIDVSDRTPYWGLGVEHEMQLFHKARSGMQNTNIMFDSQESTCFLINDKESCCKSRVEMFGKCDDFTEDAKKYKDGVLLKERDNIFKSVKFDRNNLKIILTWESYNGVKISIEYKALNSQTITARGDKCTSIEVIDKDGLYTTFVFVFCVHFPQRKSDYPRRPP